jgi:polyisoprenoid-binding protein YceI
MPRIASFAPLLAAPLLAIAFSTPGVAATAKSGAVCTKAGSVSGTLTCTKKAGKLVWSKATAAAPATSSATLDGTWKPTAESKVGYRAKEVLFGQKAEAVGQTSAVTGTLTIAGPSVTAVELTADLTKLASSESRRDSQVQGRILETAKFPNATLKLLKPIDFGKVPAEGVEVKQKGSVELTVKAVTKTVDVDVTARVKAGKIEIAGSIPLTWADWGINDPSFAGQITVEPKGVMEFLVVFAK